MNGKSLTYGALASFLLLLAPLPISNRYCAAGQDLGTGLLPDDARRNFEVTALSDGTVDLKIEDLLTNTTAAKIRSALARAHLKDPVETSVNTYLINTGSKLVMIDAGAGVFFGPTLGKLIATSKRPAINRNKSTRSTSRTCIPIMSAAWLWRQDRVSNAVVRADRRDADFWPSKANMDTAERRQTGFRRRDGVH